MANYNIETKTANWLAKIKALSNNSRSERAQLTAIFDELMSLTLKVKKHFFDQLFRKSLSQQTITEYEAKFDLLLSLLNCNCSPL